MTDFFDNFFDNPNCPRCGSFKFYKSGLRSGKPARKCGVCGCSQVDPALQSPRGRKKEQITPACKYCGSLDTVRRGHDARGTQRYFCKNEGCSKTFSKKNFPKPLDTQ